MRPAFRALLTLTILLMVIAGVASARAAAPANTAFQRVWARTDQPVLAGQVPRTWMWGPEATTNAALEPYAESPGGQRTVQYFDKSRMEITFPGGNPGSIWYVSNGLLVVELMTGRLQLGDNLFEQHEPAQVNVAGDSDDPTGPTYATMALLRSAAPLQEGAPITWRIDRSGVVSFDPALASAGVVAVERVTVSGIDHQIASPFWAFMRSSGLVYEDGLTHTEQLFEDPFYATGYPVTEAYWARVRVGGTARDVLIQCFERRCLTYTPGNPTGFATEAGNVGAHYWNWRYVRIPAEDDDPLPPPIDPTATSTATVTPTAPTPTATSTATAEPTEPTATEEPTEEPIATPTEEPTTATEYAYVREIGHAYDYRSALSYPSGVATDVDGNVYLVDTGNNRIQKYDADGVYITGWGSFGSGNGQFFDPWGIAVDAEGYVYVVDSGNNRVQKFDTNGAYITQWGSRGGDDGQFYTPLGIAVTDYYVFVTEAGEGDVARIQVLFKDGSFYFKIGEPGTGPGQLTRPYGIAVDDELRMYVADTGNSRVQVIDWLGEFQGEITDGLDSPLGIAVDASGKIIVADSLNGRVRVYDSEYQYVEDIGSAGMGPGQHQYPAAVALDDEGVAYVVDASRNVVQSFSADGDYRFGWGDARRGAHWDPWDLALDKQGNLLVADRGFDRVMSYALDGSRFDTIVGEGTGDDVISDPGGLAVNSEGLIYVVDVGNAQVQVFQPTGEYAFRFSPGLVYPGIFCEPSGIATDERDNVYVADRCRDRVMVFDSQGEFLFEWGSTGQGAGEFHGPSGIAIRDGIVHVADDDNARIQMFALDGDYLGEFIVERAESGPNSGNHLRLTVDADGYIYVTNWSQDTVQKYAPDGTLIVDIDNAGFGTGEYVGPAGIAVGEDGVIYVIDSFGGRILVYAPVIQAPQ